MPVFAHTPYDGSKTPFSIGLEPLDLLRWIEPDENLVRDLMERDRLLAEARDVVFAAEADTDAAQREVWDLLTPHLVGRFPDIYRRHDAGIAIVPAGRTIEIGSEAPLIAAARLVQEDLVLMRQGPNGYRLVAAVLCFPSFWSLRERFGATLDQLHAPVPGYQERLATRMNRIFDHLKVDIPVWRINWSIAPDDTLHQPESRSRPRRWFDDGIDAFVRVERQTLRRLPVSGDILFTIKLHADPIQAFGDHPRGGELALSLARQVEALDDAQLRYKNLVGHRDALVKALKAFAGQGVDG